MHIELSRKQSDYWYTYWTNQFSRIWEASSPGEGHTSNGQTSADLAAADGAHAASGGLALDDLDDLYD